MLKLKTMNEKRFFEHDTWVEDYAETLENKNTKEKTKRDVKLLETFLKNKKSYLRARTAKHRAHRIKPAPCGLCSFCETSPKQPKKDARELKFRNNILTFCACSNVKSLAEIEACFEIFE